MRIKRMGTANKLYCITDFLFDFKINNKSDIIMGEISNTYFSLENIKLFLYFIKL